MAKTLLLTGRPGVGKTTIIYQVTALLGARAGGFYTQEIRGPGGRKGFRLVTLAAGGPEAVIAHVDIRSRNRVGRYGVDVAALDSVGVAAIRKAIQAKEIVVVDEIGKMEMFSGEIGTWLRRPTSYPSFTSPVAMARVASAPPPNPYKCLPTTTAFGVIMPLLSNS